MKQLFFTLGLIATAFSISAQHHSSQDANNLSDSLYIAEIQESMEPDKVLHAEPLYIDLIRDLGARKGEKEWNIGLGLTDQNEYDLYTALVEYEFAPVNRLGLEVELPFSLYYPVNGDVSSADIPGNRLNSLKLAAQYTFLVSQRHKTSLALGYIHEFELAEFSRYGKDQLLQGHLFNPFFVGAKRWNDNFHSLVYTGPMLFRHLGEPGLTTEWQINTNFHYMIRGTRNFIGIEFNKELKPGDFDLTVRPQMRLGIADNLLIGIVTGIPINRETERFSTFFRLIYEPGHHKSLPAHHL